MDYRDDASAPSSSTDVNFSSVSPRAVQIAFAERPSEVSLTRKYIAVTPFGGPAAHDDDEDENVLAASSSYA